MYWNIVCKVAELWFILCLTFPAGKPLVFKPQHQKKRPWSGTVTPPIPAAAGVGGSSAIPAAAGAALVPPKRHHSSPNLSAASSLSSNSAGAAAAGGSGSGGGGLSGVSSRLLPPSLLGVGAGVGASGGRLGSLGSLNPSKKGGGVLSGSALNAFQQQQLQQQQQQQRFMQGGGPGALNPERVASAGVSGASGAPTSKALDAMIAMVEAGAMPLPGGSAPTAPLGMGSAHLQRQQQQEMDMSVLFPEAAAAYSQGFRADLAGGGSGMQNPQGSGGVGGYHTGLGSTAGVDRSSNILAGLCSKGLRMAGAVAAATETAAAAAAAAAGGVGWAYNGVGGTGMYNNTSVSLSGGWMSGELPPGMQAAVTSGTSRKLPPSFVPAGGAMIAGSSRGGMGGSSGIGGGGGGSSSLMPVSAQGYLRPSGAESQAALKAVIEALHMTAEDEKDVPQVRFDRGGGFLESTLRKQGLELLPPYDGPYVG